MNKGGGSEFTITIGPSKSVLLYALHSLQNVLGLARFRVFVPKLYIYITSLRCKYGDGSDIPFVRMNNVLHVKRWSGIHWMPSEEKYTGRGSPGGEQSKQTKQFDKFLF